MGQRCTHWTQLPQASEGCEASEACATLAHWLSRAIAHTTQVGLQREAEGMIEQGENYVGRQG